MSAPVAGKFSDPYEVLGVDPKADAETIATAYQKLAEKYHPRLSTTPDKAKFEAVTEAYEILSDPGARADIDRIKGIGEKEGPPKFTGADFFDALTRQGGLRTALLCLLYDRRRVKPFTPSLSMRHLEIMLQATTEELNFVIWYLKRKGTVISDDKSALQISVEGMDYLEQNVPNAADVAPYLKEAAYLTPPTAIQPPAPAPSAAANNSIASLRRSLDAAKIARGD